MEMFVFCPVNSFMSITLEGTIILCSACNNPFNYYCYESNYRSPKKNYWRTNNFCKDVSKVPIHFYVNKNITLVNQIK